jgi:hypothetical protein
MLHYSWVGLSSVWLGYDGLYKVGLSWVLLIWDEVGWVG